MALSAAVTDVSGIVFGRLAAALIHTVDRLLHHLIQMIAAGVGVAVNALHHDLRFEDVGVVPAGAHFQGIELSPKHPVVMALLNHKAFSLFIYTTKLWGI